jgi:hypothetical protein
MLAPDMNGASVQLVSGSAANCHPAWTETQVILLLFKEVLCALTCALTGEHRKINAENYCNSHFSPNRVMKWQ